MHPPTSFNNYTIQFAVVNPFYNKNGAGHNGAARCMYTLMETVSAARTTPVGRLGRHPRV